MARPALRLHGVRVGLRDDPPEPAARDARPRALHRAVRSRRRAGAARGRHGRLVARGLSPGCRRRLRHHGRPVLAASAGPERGRRGRQPRTPAAAAGGACLPRGAHRGPRARSPDAHRSRRRGGARPGDRPRGSREPGSGAVVQPGGKRPAPRGGRGHRRAHGDPRGRRHDPPLHRGPRPRDERREGDARRAGRARPVRRAAGLPAARGRDGHRAAGAHVSAARAPRAVPALRRRHRLGSVQPRGRHRSVETAWRRQSPAHPRSGRRADAAAARRGPRGASHRHATGTPPALRHLRGPADPVAPAAVATVDDARAAPGRSRCGTTPRSTSGWRPRPTSCSATRAHSPRFPS